MFTHFVITFFVISKQFAIRSSVFVLAFSLFLFIFEKIPNMYHYVANDAGETMLSGLAFGVSYMELFLKLMHPLVALTSWHP